MYEDLTTVQQVLEKYFDLQRELQEALLARSTHIQLYPSDTDSLHLFELEERLKEAGRKHDELLLSKIKILE